MAEAEASVPVASSPAATLTAVTSTSSARAMAGDSVLVPAGAVVDDAGDAMLVMPLSPKRGNGGCSANAAAVT